MSYARSLAVLFAIVGAGAVSATAEEKPVEIPLDQIWSNAAEGARSLQSLEPELILYRDTPEKIKKYSTPEGLAEFRYKAKQSLVLQIERALQKLPLGKETNKPRAGFAVEGVGRYALVGVHDALVMNKGPRKSFPANADISVVFFSYPSRARVQIDRIERQGNDVRIHYLLISDGVLYTSSTLALIPLGQLPLGDYRVEMVRSSAKEPQYNQRSFPPAEAGAEERIICRPFEFAIAKQKRGNPSDSSPH